MRRMGEIGITVSVISIHIWPWVDCDVSLAHQPVPALIPLLARCQKL